ncbi:hypothetical protein [Streptomyces mirabilis]|uniref:hypothetical protein n=1 Tax=Streptomyces mirabilis TaxID=68239 RepID=UPI0036DAD79E
MHAELPGARAADDCFAIYLAVKTGDDEDTRSASEVSQLARDAAQGDGWVVGSASSSR